MSKLAPVTLALFLCLGAFGGAAVVTAREVSLGELENLRRLDDVKSAPAPVLVTKAAFTWVNENVLGYLPTLAVLRAEDAIAGIVLRLAGEEPAPNPLVVERTRRLEAEQWAAHAVAREVVKGLPTTTMALSGMPHVAFITERLQ